MIGLERRQVTSITSTSVGPAPFVTRLMPGFFQRGSSLWLSSTQAPWFPTFSLWRNNPCKIATCPALAAAWHWRPNHPRPASSHVPIEEIVYAAKANIVALHRDDETIAVIEIVSPGNKGSQIALRQFVEKSLELLESGIHLLVVDLFPPTRRDPEGIHPAIWSGINDEPFALPADKRLTLASYVAGTFKTAYVEPVAAGDSLPAMPLFLDAKKYIRVPLEETYEATWKACPEEFKQRVI